jgi:membrane fusion protein, multidrug efflux system
MNDPLRLPIPDDPAAAPRHDAPPAASDLGFALPSPARVSRTRVLAIGATIAAVLAALFLARWLPMRHAREAHAADARQRETAAPRVQVVKPTAIASDRAFSLPGSILPLEETIVYPRASGYVRKWHVDLGDKVAEGDLLAEIDTPELDQQLAQARAQLAQAEAGLVQAEANSRFSKDELDRYRKLNPDGLVSKQDLSKRRAQAEVDQASVVVASANIRAQRANIQLLTQLKSFARVTAPFAGTITARSVERGALVTAGTATPLFKLAATEIVRVIVQVPQDVAASVRVGVPAAVTLREFPKRAFEGKVSRSAGALDATTRTMSTEVRVPNEKGELLAGMYAQVSLTLPTSHRVLAVPATAILNDATGVHVVVIDASGRARHATVVIERDTGPTVEIASGLSPDDRVVRLPSAELTDGREVEIAP